MFATLALLLGSLQIISIPPAEGRFETEDTLGEASKDLQYAFIIFRHGIRAPVNNIYASDEQFAKYWPGDKGGLTEDGKRLMVHVGRSLRTRYKNLVPDYDQDQVVLTSTTVARTTMSAYAVAAGMFPPSEPIIADIPAWQPVPVLHNQVPDKSLLFDQELDNSMCPRYTKIRDSIIREEMAKLSQSQRKDLLNINRVLSYYSNSPDKKINTITSLDDLFNVWDVYFMEELNNKALQQWTKKIMTRMLRLAQFRLWSRMHGKIDDQHSILQYYTGPLLNQIMNEMIQQHNQYFSSLLEGATPRARLHLHGSHDLTVGALVWALVDQRTFMAYPGDALILEADRHARVKLLLYSPLRSKKLQELSLKGLCNEKTCSIEQLIKGLKQLGLSYSEDVWKQKCSYMGGTESTMWRETSTSHIQNLLKLLSFGRKNN